MRIKLAALVAVAVLPFSQPYASAESRPDFDQGVDVRSTLSALKVPSAGDLAAPGDGAPVVPAQADWTIMYFINAKNNLSGYVDPDMKHMEEVGSSDRVKIVVEMGKEEGSVKRYLVKKGSGTGPVSSPVVEDLGDADMGDWKTLAAFGKWAKANHPAKHYLLSIWNHGSGWVKSRAERDEVRTEGISYDDRSGHHMNTAELAQALAAMGGVDIYASDACLMQMAEVAYELRPYAGVVIGSEENEPAAGWNYARYMGPLAANPGMTPAELSRTYVEAFRSSYAEQGRNTTQSALDPNAFRDFVPLLNAWTGAVMQANEKDAVKRARDGVQSFNNSDNIDLLHLVSLIGAGTQAPAVRSAGERLASFAREKLLLTNGVTGDRHRNASGLSVYLPTGAVSGDYAELAWARESGWPAFARWVSGLYSQGTVIARGD